MFIIYRQGDERPVTALRTKSDIMAWIVKRSGIAKKDINVIRTYKGDYHIDVLGYCYTAVKQPK